jgi:hypothetical protein
MDSLYKMFDTLHMIELAFSIGFGIFMVAVFMYAVMPSK